MKTNYNKNGKIGDNTTITTHLTNYIPSRILTLQAEMTENFPDFMKEDEKSFFNIICFEELADNQTRVTSYGIGYKNNEKFFSLMKFFMSANEATTKKLLQFLETGIPIEF